MENRKYRIVVAATKPGLVVAAGRWTILNSTVKEFDALETNDDHSLGRIGAVTVKQSGWVGLAYIDQ